MLRATREVGRRRGVCGRGTENGGMETYLALSVVSVRLDGPLRWIRQVRFPAFGETMTQLRIGLIGCGRIARLTHLHAIAQLPALQLVAVADPDEKARALMSAQLKGIATYASPEEVFRHPGIQAVLIATPPATHVPIALRAIAAGLHVYLEKPTGCSAAESETLVAAWRESGLVGMVGFNQRAHPLMERARGLIRSGRIGKPTLVRSVFAAAPRELPDWKQKRNSGGGVLLDLASHHLDLLPWLLDARIESISASTASRFTDDDSANLTLRFEGGLEGQIAATMNGAETDRIEIMGDAGALTIDRFANRIDVRAAKRARSRGERFADAFAILKAAPGRAWGASKTAVDPSYRLSLERFAGAIAGGNPVSPDLQEGHRVMIALDAAMKSAANDGRFEPMGGNAEELIVETEGLENPAVRTGIAPALSIVLVASEGFQSIARVVHYLSRQTARESIELILVGASTESLLRDSAPWVGQFHSIRAVENRKLDNVDVAGTPGIRAAQAPVVALIEDHAYPDPKWAAAILKAHEGPYVAVGSAFRNANPSSLLSWANLLMSYGSWSEPVHGGETTSISRHNVSFKKTALENLPNLEDLFGRGGALLGTLRKNGGRFFLASDAIVEHVNFSRLLPTLTLRVQGARLSAASRARLEHWSVAKRAVYVLCGALIPFLRARVLIGKVLAPSPYASRLKLASALALGSVLDAVGQVIGFAIGAGQTAERLADFERRRERFLSQSDRSMLSHRRAPA